jgi:hypothetical protein
MEKKVKGLLVNIIAIDYRATSLTLENLYSEMV